NQNIVLGLLVGLVGVANLATARALPSDGRTAAPILAAALLCLLCIVTARPLLRAALSKPSRNRGARTAELAVSPN
ncbi:MAG TPA: hypothetical protein VFD94_07295, partial [Jatrophihabitans sp.]|nr:hypothetical protein [Jatrophihabitans sp.]